MEKNALSVVADQPVLDSVADPLRRLVQGVYKSGGEAGEIAKNAMHGVWLGHPLHPVFTDIPLGAWTAALALDVSANGDRGMQRAATMAMGVGLLGAAASAVTGLTDWSETDGRARREGLLHGLLNIAATTLMAASYIRRAADDNAGGRAFAWAGTGASARSRTHALTSVARCPKAR